MKVFNLGHNVPLARTSGSPKKIGLYEIDRWGISVEDEFIDLIQNPSDKNISKNFYSDVPRGSVPLDNYFVDRDQTAHILDLLKSKPRTATHILLYGPPGTGKSELARHIADRMDREIICKRISDLQSMWVGAGEKNIKAAFQKAEAEEAVLIIDEADSVLFSRDRARHSWEISFTNEFLTRMEKFRGILVCTTNRLDDLDPASLRRFNHKVGFDYLTPVGNLLFYDLFLGPLSGDLLGHSGRKEIKAVQNLAPGDFKVVRDRYSFYPTEDINHNMLIEALKKEAELKSDDDHTRQIGF